MTTVAVPAALAGERLDRVVATVTGVSRAVAAALVDGGAVELDGRVERSAKTRVAEGASLTVEVPEPEPIGVQGDPTVELDVVLRGR